MNTIKKSSDIKYILNKGKWIKTKYINIVYIEDNNIKGDWAFIASKKNGNAVWRNTAKRRLRVIKNLLKLKSNNKYIFLANKNILKLNFWDVYKTIYIKLLENKLIYEKNN